MEILAVTLLTGLMHATENTYLCGNGSGFLLTYNYNEEICCYGIYPKYKDIWEQKCCKDVRKPYSFGLELCCNEGIKKNIPGIESHIVCNGNTTNFSRSEEEDDYCQQTHGEHFLFCESTRNCYNPKEKTCCPNSQLYDTPSSKGICCEQKIYSLKDDLPCRSPKQNYLFCQSTFVGRHSKKERKMQLEKICNSSHTYIIEIDKMEFKRNRNLYFTASVSQLVDQGFQQSVGNTTRHSIPLDIWIPPKCKYMIERSTFLVLSMTPPKKFLQDLLYMYEKTETIFKKYKTSKCSLQRIVQDFRQIKARCIVKGRENTHSKRKKKTKRKQNKD
ncbi:hypothetical protein CHS0354_027484 [Potamilus streckersoni]|uniref:Uncharacterized protein n=1 Tax=Potamilus streckersoni TaxID=2493646 RepID=A0AAE0VPH7_9BIVA|nr:hypothetical protein CHS0354_027484 [Potamilus streckersoni]